MRNAITVRLGDKQRLLAILVLLLAGGFAGTSFLAYRAAAQSLRASIEERELPVAAESVYARLQKDLVEPLFVSSMMANDTFLHDWVHAGETDPEAVRKYLAEVQSRYSTLTAFFVSDRSFRYYHPSGVLKSVSPTEWRDTWYWRVRSMAEPYELNVDVDLANDDALTIFINYRVLDSEGVYLGTAGVGLSVEAMSGMAARLRDEYGTAVYFTAPDGSIIAGRPEGWPGEPAAAPRSVRDLPGLAAVATRALAEGGGSYRYRSGGHGILLHVRPIPELGWFLFLEQDETASFAGARRALNLNLGLYAAVLVLALLAVGFTVDRFQKRLERAATHDPLTGAFNRLAFEALAAHAIKAAGRGGEPLSAVMMDADGFKQVNDTWGHAEGDAVLVAIVRSAGAALRSSDLLCRWGGEEFAALLPSCPVAEALAVAEKLRAAVAAETAASCRTGIRLSAGVATLGPDEDLSSLLARADAALLEAKRSGKNRAVAAES